MNSLLLTQNSKPYLLAPSSVLIPIDSNIIINVKSNLDFNVTIIDNTSGLIGRLTNSFGSGTCDIAIEITRTPEQSRFAIIELQPVNSTLPAVTITLSQMENVAPK